MVKGARLDLLPAVTAWLGKEPEVHSAVLFGSMASRTQSPSVDVWSDLDLHVVTTASRKLERLDWAAIFPEQGFIMQIVRPATGGVRKVTAVFTSGQLELVLVPEGLMKSTRREFEAGRHKASEKMQIALDEMATCLRGGYRFLKGKKEWGTFYQRVEREMTGVRLSDPALTGLADIFLCDLLWVFQKLERGELSAAQHVLHRSLAETNFRLSREKQLRQGNALVSFGLGRRVETTLGKVDLAAVQVSARLKRSELIVAAWHTFEGLQNLMSALVPTWRPAPGMRALLSRYALKPAN